MVQIIRGFRKRVIDKIEYYSILVFLLASTSIVIYNNHVLKSHVKTMDKAVSTYYIETKAGIERSNANRTLIDANTVSINQIKDKFSEFEIKLNQIAEKLDLRL